MENVENQKQVFHRFPPPLEIAGRFPHSRSPGDDRVEKWKSNRRIPTFPRGFPCGKNFRKRTPERRTPLNAGFPVVQAHRSIGICYRAEAR
jgi:hypothetical protein